MSLRLTWKWLLFFSFTHIKEFELLNVYKWFNGLRETVLAMIVFETELLLKSNKNFKQSNLWPSMLYFDEKLFYNLY